MAPVAELAGDAADRVETRLQAQVAERPTPYRSSPATVSAAPPRAAGAAKPHLSIVIVNYRQWENTARLVRQLGRSRALRRGVAEIVIVDNHSPPHRLMARMRRWPGVSLRRWTRNRGFARAVNEGCRLSEGEWFLLLNPDMSVRPQFVGGVLKVVDELGRREPRAGIVGFGLRSSDATPQMSSGPFPTLAGTLVGLAWPRHRRKYARPPAPRLCPVPWVTGCCLAIRRDCFRALGGLASDYFLYYEDVDLCRRAMAAGWSVWHEPRLSAVHHNPSHSRSMPAALRLITRHSLLTYARRHWSSWQFRLLAGIVWLEAGLRRLWARRKDDMAAAALYEQMGALGLQLARGHQRAARRRLEAIVRAHAESLGDSRQTDQSGIRRQDRRSGAGTIRVSGSKDITLA